MRRAGGRDPEGWPAPCAIRPPGSNRRHEGQPVQLSVVEAVFVNEVEVIPSGASVHGAVVTAVPKRRMGRTGKLDFSIYACRLSDFHRTAHCVLTVCVSRGGKRTHEFPTLYGAA